MPKKQNNLSINNDYFLGRMSRELSSSLLLLLQFYQLAIDHAGDNADSFSAVLSERLDASLKKLGKDANKDYLAWESAWQREKDLFSALALLRDSDDFAQRAQLSEELASAFFEIEATLVRPDVLLVRALLSFVKEIERKKYLSEYWRESYLSADEKARSALLNDILAKVDFIEAQPKQIRASFDDLIVSLSYADKEKHAPRSESVTGEPILFINQSDSDELKERVRLSSIVAPWLDSYVLVYEMSDLSLTLRFVGERGTDAIGGAERVIICLWQQDFDVFVRELFSVYFKKEHFSSLFSRLDLAIRGMLAHLPAGPERERLLAINQACFTEIKEQADDLIIAYQGALASNNLPALAAAYALLGRDKTDDLRRYFERD